MTENQRLKILMNELNFKSQREFAEAIDLKPGSLSDILREKPGVGVSAGVKQKLERSYRVSLDWLEKGKGEMFLPDDKMLTTANMIDEAEFSFSTIPSDYDHLMDKIEHLRLMLQVKDEQLADKDALIRSKDELIQSLREQIAMKSGGKEADKHSAPRPL